jgi:hypothetical protein
LANIIKLSRATSKPRLPQVPNAWKLLTTRGNPAVMLDERPYARGAGVWPKEAAL